MPLLRVPTNLRGPLHMRDHMEILDNQENMVVSQTKQLESFMSHGAVADQSRLTKNESFNPDMEFDLAYDMLMSGTDKSLDFSPESIRIPKTPDTQFRLPSISTLTPEMAKGLEMHRQKILQNGVPPGSPDYSPHIESTTSPGTRSLLHQINSQSYELLSISESHALESFLDSIVDDERLNSLSKHWPLLDPFGTKHSESEHMEPSSEWKTSSSPPTDSCASVGLKRKNSEACMREAKRALLSEREKRKNHTTAEQRRRDAIKDAFDHLVGLVADKPHEKKKRVSKFTIMQKAIDEVEKLQRQNSQLRDLVA